jgi:hypothetical protein
MMKSICFFASLSLLVSCQLQELTDARKTSAPSEAVLAQDLGPVRYEKSDLHKLKWIIGAWKAEEAGKTLVETFKMTAEGMEIIHLNKDGEETHMPLFWEDGRFYLGAEKQWMVTWIGEKDVKLEATREGLYDMTWTRGPGNLWYAILETEKETKTYTLHKSPLVYNDDPLRSSGIFHHIALHIFKSISKSSLLS